MSFEGFTFKLRNKVFRNSDRVVNDKTLLDISIATERDLNEIRALHKTFTVFSTNGELDKKQFFKMYSSMRHEDSDRLSDITEFIFRAFDKDKSGTIDFEEFAVKHLNINFIKRKFKEFVRPYKLC